MADREGRAFGRAITVHQATGSGPQGLPRGLRLAAFTAEDQPAETRGECRLGFHHLLEISGRQEHGGNAMTLHRGFESGRRQQLLLVDHHHAAPVQERCPDLEGHRVKGCVRHLADAVVGSGLVKIGFEGQTAHRPLRHQDPFGFTGRARGVDDVSGEIAVDRQT